MKNILLEGANATGKTTVMNIVRGLYPESTFIEFHDFYHEHVINLLKLKELHEPKHWQKLTEEQKEMIEKYLQKRNDTVLSFIREQIFNRIIIERLFLTHAVYSKLIMNKDISSFLPSWEEKFNDCNIVLILITCETDVLRNILEDNIKNKEGRNAPTSQYHLKSVEIGLKKNELYNEYFGKLKYIKKVTLKNYGGSVDDLKKETLKLLEPLSI